MRELETKLNLNTMIDLLNNNLGSLIFNRELANKVAAIYRAEQAIGTSTNIRISTNPNNGKLDFKLMDWIPSSEEEISKEFELLDANVILSYSSGNVDGACIAVRVDFTNWHGELVLTEYVPVKITTLNDKDYIASIIPNQSEKKNKQKLFFF